MEEACQGEPSNFVIYAGYEFDDLCLYRPHSFAPEMLNYITRRKMLFNENWRAVETFEPLSIQAFASLKAFGTLESAQRMIYKIECQSGLHVPLIRDPFQKGHYVVQATHPSVNKGEAVKDLKQLLKQTFVIAAGDDNNDRTMLAEANIKVVMATAPEDMLINADVIAPSAEHLGIIEGLSKAIGIK
jgi:hydroxymethylpyrimidine pyrophosphatase-like HAD family hydrolase